MDNNRVIKTDEGFDEELEEKYTKQSKGEYVLLKVYNEILKQIVDQNNNDIDINIKDLVIKVLQKPENDLTGDVINLVARNERLIRSLLDIVSESNVPKKEIKVSEINLTKGLMTEEVDNYLASAAIYPIDVDYSIAVKSIDNVNEELKKKSFKFVEWDVNKSDFPSDMTLNNLVVVKDSIHLWNLENFVQELYNSINTKGFLIFIFRYRLTEPEKSLKSMNIKEVTDEQLVHRIIYFMKEAESVGFSLVCRKMDSIGSMALLFRKVVTKEPPLPKTKNVIDITSNPNKWFERVKQLFLENKERDDKENIWLIASDSSKNGIIGLINCLRLEPGGETIRCIFDYDNTITLPINFRKKPFSDILVNDLAVNVLRDGKLGTYRHLTLPKDYDQTLSDDYYLNTGLNRDLSSLQWYSLKNMSARTKAYDLINRKCDLVKCKIYSSGLNFKDVMFVTGK